MMFQCSRCPFRGNKKNCITHFIVKHAPADQVPFLCQTCNFKAITLGRWQRHIRDDVKKPYSDKEHTCSKSLNPYAATVGKDIYEIPEVENIENHPPTVQVVEEEVIIEEVEEDVLEVKVDPRDEKIVELESTIEDMKTQHEQEIKNLEAKHKFECLRFGNFIERLEKRKQELKGEIQKLTEKLKRKEDDDDDDFTHKRVRSVVIPKPIKRRLDF